MSWREKSAAASPTVWQPRAAKWPTSAGFSQTSTTSVQNARPHILLGWLAGRLLLLLLILLVLLPGLPAAAPPRPPSARRLILHGH